MTTEKKIHEQSTSWLRSAKAVGVITLLSRITGLARESVQAALLGTTPMADAFRVAFLLPNLLRRLVGEGAVQSGFVPVFSAWVARENRESIRIFAEKCFTLWTVLLALVTLVGIGLSGLLLAPILVASSEGEWSVEQSVLTSRLTQALFVYVIFIGLSALAQGVLHGFKVFALPATTPLLFNLCFIVAGLVFPLFFDNRPDFAAWSFVVGILVGGVLQFAVLIPALWKRGIRFVPRRPRGHPGMREIARLLVPATIGAGVYQINVMVSVFIATATGEGAVSALSYSGRLMEVVLGVYVFALSTVSLTTLSQQADAGDLAGFRMTASEVLRLVAFITIPSTVGLFILGDQIIRLVFNWGRFQEQAIDLTFAAFRFHILGLFLVSFSRVLVTQFYAFKNVWTPVRLAGLNLVLHAVLCYMLSRTDLGHAGVALASTVSVGVHCLLLWVTFQRWKGLIDGRSVAVCVGRSTIAAAVMGAACWGGTYLLPADSSKWVLGGFVAVEVLGGAGLYFATARVLGAPELSVLLARRPSTDRRS